MMLIGRVQKNSGGKTTAEYRHHRSLPPLAPLSLTSQVCYQWDLRSVCVVTQNQELIRPAFTCIYLWLVVGLPFSTAILSHPVSYLRHFGPTKDQYLTMSCLYLSLRSVAVRDGWKEFCDRMLVHARPCLFTASNSVSTSWSEYATRCRRSPLEQLPRR